MSTNKNEKRPVWLLSIQDMSRQGRLAYDLKDILHCLGPTIADYSWIISYLDCDGDKVRALCKRANKARGGVRISNDELVAVSQRIVRTKEATILGGSIRTIKRKKDGPETQLSICVYGGGYFLIVTREKSHIRRLKQRFLKVKVLDGLKFLSRFGHLLKEDEDVDFLSVLAPSDN